MGRSLGRTCGVWRSRLHAIAPLTGLSHGDGEVQPSIMMAFTQHNPSVCLTADDLDALHTIYPDCERPQGMQKVICFKSQHNIGLVRVGVYVLIPALCALS